MSPEGGTLYAGVGPTSQVGVQGGVTDDRNVAVATGWNHCGRRGWSKNALLILATWLRMNVRVGEMLKWRGFCSA